MGDGKGEGEAIAARAARLATQIRARAGAAPRFVVGIAGPPGAGKSALAEALVTALAASGESAQTVPMDGFHLDNALLDARGLRDRKGSPETFDVAGFRTLLERLREAGEGEILVPIFDRAADLARAGAAAVAPECRFPVVEGNYLLLRDPPWAALRPLFDLTIRLSVPEEELRRRLVARWLAHGLDPQAARARAEGNDLTNGRLVATRSAPADIVV